jgi:hypothetical protein
MMAGFFGGWELVIIVLGVAVPVGMCFGIIALCNYVRRGKKKGPPPLPK